MNHTRLTENEETSIVLDSAQLSVGQSIRIMCPVCLGGRDKERSMSVTRQHSGLLYNCYRSSCTAGGGYISNILSGSDDFISRTCAYDSDGYPMCQRQAQPYKGELHTLQRRDLDYFRERFYLEYIPPSTIVRSSLIDNEAQYILSLNDSRGYIRGYTVRRGGWKGKPPTPGKVDNVVPKARTFMERPDYIAQHIAYQLPKSDIVVVVEDYISSLKVAQEGLVGVALMGTTMNLDRAREISLLRPAEVVIALDKDAIEQTFTMVRQWGLSWPKTRVAMLEQDLKDTPKNDILKVLQL